MPGTPLTSKRYLKVSTADVLTSFHSRRSNFTGGYLDWEPDHQGHVYPYPIPQLYVVPMQVTIDGVANSYTQTWEGAKVPHHGAPALDSRSCFGGGRQFCTNMSFANVPLGTEGGNQATLPELHFTEGYLAWESHQDQVYPDHAPRSDVPPAPFSNHGAVCPFTLHGSAQTNLPQEEISVPHDAVPPWSSRGAHEDGRQLHADRYVQGASLYTDGRNRETISEPSEEHWSSYQIEGRSSVVNGVANQ